MPAPRHSIMKRVLVYLAGFLLVPAALVAPHDPGLSKVEVRLGPHQILAHLVFSRTEIDAIAEATTLKEDALALTLDGRAVPGQVRSIELDASDALHLELVFSANPASRLQLRSSLLPELARGHRQYVSVVDESGERIAEHVLDAQEQTLEVFLESATVSTAAPYSFVGFLILGLEHILTGYDHLLFLLGVLVAGGSFRRVVRIITSFTLAHSITLALATFDVVRIPPEIVEPWIAASILYIGLENLIRRDPKRRSLLTFLFGLVHGLGFASALHELGVGTIGGPVLTPLLAFNVGVEIGQIAVAGCVLPLLWLGDRRGRSRPAPACSILVAAAGTFWLLERTLG